MTVFSSRTTDVTGTVGVLFVGAVPAAGCIAPLTAISIAAIAAQTAIDTIDRNGVTRKATTR